MALFLGIDLGTSSVKAVLCDERGSVRATASAAYPLSRVRNLWSEQNPGDWWSATAGTIREVLERGRARGADVGAVGLSGQMHGSVLLDRETAGSGGRRGEPLRPAILWNDQRTGPQCEAIERAAGGRRALVELVGNAALPGFTLPKLHWVREHEPDVWARTASVLLPKDYLRFRLSGQLATDVGDASGLLLLDVDRREYSAKALSLFDIDPGLLPRVVESGETTGGVSAWAAGETGLRAGTPVVGGSGDNQAGAIGAGVVRPGMVLATLGTSGVIYAHAAAPHRDVGRDGQAAGRVHTMCAATGTAGQAGGWCITGCMLSAAGSLQWCLDALWPGTRVDELLAEAERAPAGSEGLVFLPYLTGERCPYPDPYARGGWIGLTSRHGRGHLVRSVLEGVAFGMAQVLELQGAIGVEIAGVRLGGGGARSSLWRRLLADCFGRPVACTNSEEGPAYGAALLAGVGAGAWSSVDAACAACIAETEVTAPDASGEEALRPTRRVYNALYHDLKDRFRALARV